MKYISFAVVIAFTACSTSIDVQRATDALAALTPECIGQIRAGELDVARPGRGTENRGLRFLADLEGGKLSRDGHVAAGWTQTGVIVKTDSRENELRNLILEDSRIDLSDDGSKLVVTGRDRTRDLTGILVVDHAGGESRRIAEDGSNAALSPDGTFVAFETDASVVVRAQESETLLELKGTRPSWSPDGATIAVLDGGLYRLVNTKTKTDKVVPIQGEPLTSLNWSANGRAAMYVTRMTTDFWSRPSCAEQYSIVVVDMQTLSEVVYHVGCSSYPERTQWLNASFCAQK